MSSANNTIETEDGTSTSIPSTTSVLDKSRSLFGNSSSVLATSQRDPTPDGQSGEASEPVAMEAETEEAPAAVNGEEPMDSSEAPVDNKEEPASPEEAAVEEEVFEKKVVSMDTTQNDDEEPEAMEAEENDEEKVEEDGEEEVEVDGEDEEEEAPVKKAKRAVAASEDDEASPDADEPVEEDVAEEEPVEEEEEAQEEVADPVEENDSEEALVVDEPEETTEAAPEAEETAEAEIEEEANQEEEAEAVDEAEQEVVNQEEVEEQDAVAEEEGPVAAEEQEEPEPSSSRRSRGRRSAAAAITSTPTTPRRGGRGRAAQVQDAPEEVVEEEVPKKRGRSTRGKKEEVVEEVPETTEAAAAEEEEVVAPKKGRSRRSAPAVEPEQVQDNGNEEAETGEPEEPVEETPKRGGRARRSAAAPATPSTPRSTRGRGKKTNVVVEEPVEEPVATEEVEEEQEQEEEPAPEPAKKTRTPRGKKAVVEEPAEEAAVDGEEAAAEEPEAPTTSSRRSARAKPAPTTPAAAPVAKKTPARGGRKKQVSVTEAAIAEVDETAEVVTPTPPVKKGRGTKSAPSTAKKEHDPYDMDTEMDTHPEPLKNIHMEVKNFGTVSYAKVGGSTPKYSSTEKAAESRMADLSAGSSSKSRRSLADMTPGKEKVKHKMTMPGRRSRGNKKEEPEDVAMEVDEQEQPTSSATPASTNRSRKRKSEAIEAVTPAKKQPIPKIPELDDEEQLKVDHPIDENEPHAPGARVYAIFQKTFYPAVILSERDGLGRYKLQFLADKVVKDVPNSGIIPLRDVAAGKIAIFEEGDVRVDSGVDDISAEVWKRGNVTITMLDDDGEPTEEVKVVEWSEISFDQAEYKEYIKIKEHNATAVVSSNITTMSEAHRARKVPVKVAAKEKSPSKESEPDQKEQPEAVVSEEGYAAPPPEVDDEDQILPMCEAGIGKNIFAGKIFMLTSANRHSLNQTNPMLKKKNLQEFLEQNGGIVTEYIDEFHAQPATLEPLLVSDTYYRTHKYLAALAHAVPCVRNTWLQRCAELGECIDYTDYILPAGSSVFDEQEKIAPQNPTTLLTNRSFFVHSTHVSREITQTGPGGTFIEIWGPMLRQLGATVVETDWRDLRRENAKFDTILVDGTFREEVMDYADEIGAIKVTSEWVIQTIILGEAPHPASHPKFDPYRLHNRNQD